MNIRMLTLLFSMLTFSNFTPLLGENLDNKKETIVDTQRIAAKRWSELASKAKAFISDPRTNAGAQLYGTALASIIGHELGHAVIHYSQGVKFNMRINPFLLRGSITVPASFYQNAPKKIIVPMLALGPIAGIATCAGILKASNIHYAYQQESNIKNAFCTGMQMSLLNYNQPESIKTGAFLSWLGNAVHFLNIRGYDGQKICEAFKLSTIKSLLPVRLW